MVTEPAGNQSEYIPSALVCVPRVPEVTEAPEIPFPELSETLPLTVYCANTTEEVIIEQSITIIIFLRMDLITLVLF